jgi:alanyl-tRNA synthetase
MTSKELKKKYLDFFVKKGHKILPNVSLIPENDPTALFISAGMHPLVPYLLGEPHPLGKRLVSNQRCLRTDDIDEVGDNRHLTFMEMLGNWSLGDYFKKEQLNWAFEFLTSPKWLGMDPKRLYVSVFEGDQDAPPDKESIAIWQEIFKSAGIKAKVGERIVRFPKEKNWWGPVGKTGPCGPDSEIFYDTGKSHDPHFGKKCHINCDCGRYIEIWNNVFMEYNKTEEGKYKKLKQHNVDTGMGTERVAAILQGKDTLFETELFSPIIKKIETISGLSYLRNDRLLERKDLRAFRIIADHLRAATFAIADGVIPSNVEVGYVVRRLIRRAIRWGRQLGIEEIFTPRIAKEVVENYSQEYPHLEQNQTVVFEQFQKEEEKFLKTLERGLKEFNKRTSMIRIIETKIIPGDLAFHLYETYGFPLELTEELAGEKGLTVDKKGFEKTQFQHQEKSRASLVKKFAGGLADHSEMVCRLHTATHLLHQALRDVLGDHVQQVGSNITPERLRFDFTHPEKLSELEIKRIERLVNQKIKADLPVRVEVMRIEEAKRRGALAFFGEKYGDKVKVYSIGDPSTGSGQVFSKEVCGGPHVSSTGKISHVRIIKEQAIGAGRRRIYAKLNGS